MHSYIGGTFKNKKKYLEKRGRRCQRLKNTTHSTFNVKLVNQRKDYI